MATTTAKILKDDEVQTLILNACNAGLGRQSEIQRVVEWAESVRISAGMLDCVLEGHLQIAGWDEGEPTFSMTDAGVRHVESMGRSEDTND